MLNVPCLVGISVFSVQLPTCYEKLRIVNSDIGATKEQGDAILEPTTRIFLFLVEFRAS